MISRDAAKRLDRIAADRYAIPPIVLMENAARHVADVALDVIGEHDGARILIVAGPGNNGGDGLAAARHLHNAGHSVAVALCAEPSRLSELCAAHHAVVQRMGIPVTPPEGREGERFLRDAAAPIERPELIIDALFGVGLDRPVEGFLRQVIGAINSLRRDGAFVLSVDVPSGLDAETGEPLGDSAVHADATVTFVGLKPGLCALGAQPFVGDAIIADIGAPRELHEELGQRLSTHQLSGEGKPPPRKPAPRRGSSRGRP